MFGLWGLGIGIMMLLFGVFAVFFFPSSLTHQEKNLSVGGIFMGILALIIGGMLIFW
jgi:hypothetical protein